MILWRKDRIFYILIILNLRYYLKYFHNIRIQSIHTLTTNWNT